jgi:hypothetical protein
VVLATVPYSGVSSFAIDATSVYWTTAWSGNGGDSALASGTVSKCPIAGCSGNPTMLATRQYVAENISLTGTTLYWLDYNAGSLMQCGIDCNDDATTFFKGPYFPGQSFAANATEAFFSGSMGSGLIEQCPVSGCGTPAPFASGQQTLGDIVVTDAGVYWTNLVIMARGKAFIEVDAGVLTCPVGGCDDGGPTVLAGGLSQPTGLVVNGTTAYWAQGNSVVSCSVTGCGGMPIPIVSLSSGFGGIRAVAVDGNQVYFGVTVEGPSPASWQIRSCPLSGCPNGSTLLASTSFESGGPVQEILVDATRLYFVSGDDSQILALAK